MIPAVSCPRAAVAASLLLAAALPAGAVSLLWEKADYGAGLDNAEVSAIATDPSGNLIVTGVYTSGATVHARTAKFDAATGALVWARSFANAGAARNEPTALAVDADGNAIVAIRAIVSQTTTNGNWIIRYAAADGAVTWQQVYGTPIIGKDSVNALALDASGNVLATGSVGNADAQWWTVKLAAASGTPIWQREFNPNVGPLQGTDAGVAIAVDGAGNAIVTGRGAGGASTTKYSGADGTPLWSSLKPAKAAHSVALDAAGNAIALSTEYRIACAKIAILGFCTVGHLAKYAAGSGALLWEIVLDPPSGWVGNTLSLVMGPTGDAFVSTTGGRDLWTARLAGDTGALRWARRHNGAGNGDDRAGGIALDAAGNPIVTGLGFNGVDADIVSLKYAAADGTILWKHEHNAGAPGSGYGVAAATVPGAVYAAGLFEQSPGGLYGWRILKLSDTADTVTRVTPFDFNRDGRADLLFRHADGTTALWLMDGMATLSIQGLFGPASNATVREVADFDGNGAADLLWEVPEGFVVSLMDGATFLSTAGILGAGSGWSPAFAADFTGDGKADILLRHSDGSHAVLVMDGISVSRTFGILGPASGWSVVRARDFDGDGKADVVIRHDDGTHVVALVDGFAPVAFGTLMGPGTGAQIAGLGDFNGDGLTDVLWKRPDGSYALSEVEGVIVRSLVTILSADSGWDVPVLGDFDGDGRTDLIGVTSDGAHAVLVVPEGHILFTNIGLILPPGSGWTAVDARDLDGDGRTDLLIRRSDGTYAAARMLGLLMPTAAGVVGPPWVLAP